MKKLNELYRAIDTSDDISLFYYPIEDVPAATIEYKGKYGIFLDLRKISTTREEKEILAHEIGHVETGATHRVDSPYDLIEKHEELAARASIHRLVPLIEFRDAIKKGYTEIWALAEYFNLGEDFIRKAVDVYQAENVL
mgnify:FL=1